jgi:hypothetical protein
MKLAPITTARFARPAASIRDRLSANERRWCTCGQGRARHVQPDRFGAGRYQQRPIGHGAAIVGADEALLRVDGNDTGPEAQIDGMLLIEGGIS